MGPRPSAGGRLATLLLAFFALLPGSPASACGPSGAEVLVILGVLAAMLLGPLVLLLIVEGWAWRYLEPADGSLRTDPEGARCLWACAAAETATVGWYLAGPCRHFAGPLALACAALPGALLTLKALPFLTPRRKAAGLPTPPAPGEEGAHRHGRG